MLPSMLLASALNKTDLLFLVFHNIIVIYLFTSIKILTIILLSTLFFMFLRPHLAGLRMFLFVVLSLFLSFTWSDLPKLEAAYGYECQEWKALLLKGYTVVTLWH